MQESTTLQKLSRKVSEMLRTYDELRMKNAQLQEQVESLKSENASKEAVVSRMQDELIDLLTEADVLQQERKLLIRCGATRSSAAGFIDSMIASDSGNNLTKCCDMRADI